jgi:SpoVK/Ycf46/Vps4 family AAA+-type ATPase/intein/homing endonuclease
LASSVVDSELETLIRARYPIIYIVSWEEKRVEDALRAIAQNRGKKIYFWTITQGMVLNPNAQDSATRDPMNALNFVMDSREQALFVLKDYHPFISEVSVTRRLRDLTVALKMSYKTLIILAPILKLPNELEKEITVVDYGLPDRDDLDRLLEGIIQSVKDNPQINTNLTDLERDQVLKAAQGLTANEAENVFAKSLVEKHRFDVDVILGEKEQIIRKSGILEYYPFSEKIDDVGGLDLLKDWMEKRTVAFTEKARAFGLPEPRGVLLLGVQGCGKSLSAKAIGSLWRLPLLRLDVGRIFAGIVGSSEENMRKAIRVAESVAPCVAGDSRVLLADGSERTIQSLYEGNETELTVLSMTEDWQIKPTAVRAITRRPAPDLYTIQLKHSCLQATSNHLHPVLRDGELHWVRTDALKTTDYVAVPRSLPTTDAVPDMIEFLPSDTRLYADGALSFARPEVQTPQRRYAASCRDADYIKVEELADPQNYPAFSEVTQFALGHGGVGTTALTRLPQKVNEDIGYLLGLIASDGFLSKRGRIGLVNTDLILHNLFSEILNRNFDLHTKIRLMASQEVPLRRGRSEQSAFRPCYNSYVDNWLLHKILSRIQARLFSMPTTFLNAWLRGYFDGDGFVSNHEAADPKITLTSKRKEQNRLVRSVLLRAGFPTTNPESANIEITGIHNVRRFITQIGSCHSCRKEQMDAWLQKAVTAQPKERTDAIPIGDRLRRVRQNLGMGSQHLRSTSSSLMNRYERNQGHPNRDRLRAIVMEMRDWAEQRGLDVTEVEVLQKLVDSPIAWSQVVSVKAEETPEYVYDLVCCEPNNFIVNNIYTHNCVLWLDELEKGFSGTQSSGMSDGGTTARVFGTFLTWMQDKRAAAFVVATSNDVTSLPPELLRKGRFDEIFFIDLPSKEERKQIFKIHLQKRKRNPDDFDLEQLAAATPGFSGAEIEAVVVEALYDAFDEVRELTTESIIAAAHNSVPLSMTMSERIEELRAWAETRARPASSAHSEDMNTIREELMVAKATDPTTHQIDPSAVKLKNALPPPPPPPLEESE